MSRTTSRFHGRLSSGYVGAAGAALLAVLILSSADPAAAQLEGTVHRRVTRVSAIEFALHNSGMFYGTASRVGWAPFLMHWPRGSYHMIG
jgi:hypothetical protein